MRIIAGECRGRRIEGPSDENTRPTSDLVREAIFNILGERVEGSSVFDLFAGSGALGLEALSRGASRAVFVDINRENIGVIRRNVQTLGYSDVTKVTLADAHRFGRAFEPEIDRHLIIFLDPPYVEYQRHKDKIGDLIGRLVEKCPPGSTVVVESGKHWDVSVLPDADEWDVRRYGGTEVAFRWIEAPADEQDQEANNAEIGIEDGEA